MWNFSWGKKTTLWGAREKAWGQQRIISYFKKFVFKKKKSSPAKTTPSGEKKPQDNNFSIFLKLKTIIYNYKV